MQAGAGLPFLVITLSMALLIPVAVALSVYGLVSKKNRKLLPLLLSLAGAVGYATMMGAVVLATFWPYDRTPTEGELLLMGIATTAGWVFALVAVSASLALSARGLRGKSAHESHVLEPS